MKRFKNAKIASILGVLGNSFLLIIKGTIGIITNSQAMIADTFNSAGDILSSLMTFIGNKIASKPSDEDHNFGHGKAEYIYSMLISLVMIITSIFVLNSSIFSILKKQKYTFSIWLILVCIVTILVKFLLFIYTNKIAKNQRNLLVKANSLDHRNDCLITSLNLISVLFAYFNIYFVDGIVGIIISIWIALSSFKIFLESYDVLMDKSISNDTKNQVYEIVKKDERIKKIHNFKSTPIGYKYQISLTIYVDGNLSTFDSHEIADNLKRQILNEIEEIYLVIIHVNPL